jgi:hypothetical protein
MGDPRTVTITDPSAPGTVVAKFKADVVPPVIDPWSFVAGEGGDISPSGAAVPVTEHVPFPFTVTPAVGFSIDTILVNDVLIEGDTA